MTSTSRGVPATLYVHRGGARVPLKAEAHGPLAVVKAVDRAWSVFHIRSGYGVSQEFSKKRDAVFCCGMLLAAGERLGPDAWEFDEAPTPDFRKEIIATLEAVRDDLKEGSGSDG